MISIQHLQLVEGLKLQPCLLKLLPSVRQLLDQSRRATLSKDFEPLNDDDDDDGDDVDDGDDNDNYIDARCLIRPIACSLVPRLPKWVGEPD